MKRAFSATAALAVLLLIVACGDDDDGGPEDDDGSPLLALLGAIPDTTEAAQFVSYADHEAYYDALGVGGPPSGGSEDQMNEWLGELSAAERESGAAVIMGGSQFALDALRDAEAFRTEIGVDAADIRQAIEAGAPPETFTVLRGGFDSGDIADAVEIDKNFNDLIEEGTRGEVRYHTWGGDFEQDFARNSPVHSLGRGGRLALHDNLLMWCFWTDGMNGMIDAATNATDSLADHPEFVEMVNVLDENGAYFFNMSATPTDDESTVAPYGFITEGGGSDADGEFMLILIGSGNESTASETAEYLRTTFEEGDDPQGNPWSERVESIDVVTEGTMTIATLRGEGLPFGAFLLRRDITIPGIDIE